jgi:hypothetical protein
MLARQTSELSFCRTFGLWSVRVHNKRLFKVILAGTVLLLLLSTVACISLGGPASPEEVAGMTWSVTFGKDRCRFVRFNDIWTTIGSGRPIYISDKLEFRNYKGAPPTEVLVSAKDDSPIGDFYTQEKFGFDLSNPSRVWQIDESQWRDAAVLPLTQDSCDRSLIYAAKTREQQVNVMGTPTWWCEGREYVKTGKWLGSALLSPSRAFLALGSWNGEFRGFAPQSILFTGPSELDGFIEVFETATGRKLATVKAHIDGRVGTPFFYAPTWLNGRYLVIPVHRYLRECLICDFVH